MPRRKGPPRKCATCGADLITRGNKRFCSSRCHFEALYERRASDECWPWTADYGRGTGYGIFRPGATQGERMSQNAHRYSFELYNRPLVAGEVVMHKCDNRICVNPSHLVAGSLNDNNQDAKRKMRHKWGERGSKLTEDQARMIRENRISYKKAVADFGISEATYYLIRQGKRWLYLK